MSDGRSYYEGYAEGRQSVADDLGFDNPRGLNTELIRLREVERLAVEMLAAYVDWRGKYRIAEVHKAMEIMSQRAVALAALPGMEVPDA